MTRARLDRNVAGFPLTATMTKHDRIRLEATMMLGFQALLYDPDFGGQVYSMTPHTDWQQVTGEPENPRFMDNEQYQKLFTTHVMFGDLGEVRLGGGLGLL